MNLGYNKNNKADYVYGETIRTIGGDRFDGWRYPLFGGLIMGSSSFGCLFSAGEYRTTANLFAKVDWQYLKTHSYDFDHRMVMSVSWGVILNGER